MIIRKSDKFKFHLSKWNDKTNQIEVIYQDQRIFDNYYECRKIANSMAIKNQVYFGINKI